jgi:leader peptidase (prepilin peptidase)/N-methyltransferase
MACLSASLWLKFSAPGALGNPMLSSTFVAWGFFFVLVALLISIAMIDLDTMLIPDVLSVYPIPLGVLAAWLCSDITGVTVVDSVLGMLLGGGTLLVVTYGYFAVTGREGMGLGDYRLMGLVGAFLGWKSLLFLLLASALQGLVFALITYYSPLKRELPDSSMLAPELGETSQSEIQSNDEVISTFAIPFGPFIALSALEWITFEPWLMALFRQYIFAP